MGKERCHKRSKQEVQEVGAQDSRESSSQQPVMIIRGEGIGEGRRLEVHDWARGQSKSMLVSQKVEGRTDKSCGPGTERDKHPRQHTAESRGKGQISNLDMRG